jgi:hypothetical protein
LGFDWRLRLSNNFYSSIDCLHLDVAIRAFGFRDLHEGSFKNGMQRDCYMGLWSPERHTSRNYPSHLMLNG